MTDPPAAPCWSNIVKSHVTATGPHHPSPAAAAGGAFVESCKSAKGIAVAVVDANAVISGGEGLSGIAERFGTVAEVREEIRDPVSRHRLGVVPFSIDTREPSPEALKKGYYPYKKIHRENTVGAKVLESDMAAKLCRL